MFKRNQNGQFMENVFSAPEFEFLYDNVPWVGTEKVDGTNIRIHPYQHPESEELAVEIAGRTDNAHIPEFLLKELHKIFTPESFEDVFTDYSSEIILYGEGYGNRIQKVGKSYIPDGVSFVLFDIQINGIFLKQDDVLAIATALKIDVVPRVYVGTLKEAVETVRKGFRSMWGDFLAEGLVLTPEVALLDRMGRRIITKVKTRDFR